MEEESICPAYAGMILFTLQSRYMVGNLSRVCGDDPGPFERYEGIDEFVPRMRG